MTRFFALATIGCVLLGGLLVGAQTQTDWPTVVGDLGGQKYTPLDQITPANVTRLAKAWSYGPGGPSPLVVNDLMYFNASGSVVAINATTGAELWKYTLANATTGTPVRRGLTYWPGDPTHAPRILVTLSQGKLVQIEAKTGQLVPGGLGVMDLVAGIMDKFPGENYAVAAPVAVYKNIVIVTGRTGEQGRWGIPGDPRGFDLLTGKELWRFHVVPYAGEENFGTWGLNGWQERRGPGSWQPMTVDRDNGLVFIALGNATDQNYGNHRPGDNLYAASIIALDATTGKRKWHFQITHHDIYDWDLNASAILAESTINGRKVPVVVQSTKQGYVFILNRLTGEPVFGAEDRVIPPTDAVGDKAAATQPFPVKPVPLSRDSMRRSEMAKLSPESEKYCQQIYDQSVNMGPYTPYGLVPSSVPGIDRRGQQRRRRVRPRSRPHLRERPQRRHDRAAHTDDVVGPAAVVRQDEDAVRLLPRPRGYPATPRRGPNFSASTPTPATSSGAQRWRVQGADRKGHPEDGHGDQLGRATGDGRRRRVHRAARQTASSARSNPPRGKSSGPRARASTSTAGRSATAAPTASSTRRGGRVGDDRLRAAVGEKVRSTKYQVHKVPSTIYE